MDLSYRVVPRSLLALSLIHSTYSICQLPYCIEWDFYLQQDQPYRFGITGSWKPWLLSFWQFSWRFVERPLRNGPLCLIRKPPFASAAIVILVFIALLSIVILGGGFRGRFSAASVQIASYLDSDDGEKLMRRGTCFIVPSNHFKDYDFNLCLYTKASKNYLLRG